MLSPYPLVWHVHVVFNFPINTDGNTRKLEKTTSIYYWMMNGFFSVPNFFQTSIVFVNKQSKKKKKEMYFLAI